MRAIWRPAAALAAAAVFAGCGGDEWRATEIGLVEVADQRLIVGPHCNDDARVTAEETDEEILVSFEVKGEVEGECYGVAEVVLDEPVGDRTLIDAATGEPADVGTHS